MSGFRGAPAGTDAGKGAAMSVFKPGEAVVVEVLGRHRRAMMVVSAGETCLVRFVDGELTGMHKAVPASEVRLATESLEVLLGGSADEVLATEMKARVRERRRTGAG